MEADRGCHRRGRRTVEWVGQPPHTSVRRGERQRRLPAAHVNVCTLEPLYKPARDLGNQFHVHRRSGGRNA